MKTPRPVQLSQLLWLPLHRKTTTRKSHQLHLLKEMYPLLIRMVAMLLLPSLARSCEGDPRKGLSSEKGSLGENGPQTHESLSDPKMACSAGAANRSPRPSSADRDSSLCHSLSAGGLARYASPPVRVERERPCEVKAVQVEGRGVGARSSERQRRALTSHGTLSVPAWEAAFYVLSTCNNHRPRYEGG